MSIAVKKNIWESFESILMAKSKVFIKDIAARLSVPEDKLIKEILVNKNTVKAYLLDTCDDDSYCKAAVPLSDGKLAARCRGPIHRDTSYCIQHQFSRPLIQTCIDHGLPVPRNIYRLKESSDLPTLWFDDNGTVFDAQLAVRGHFDRDTKKLILTTVVNNEE
jgi:hypothetical protein